MNPSVELFAKFSDYLNKRIALDDLKTWMAPHLPEFFSSPDTAAGQLAAIIELSIYEFEDGLKTELAVRRRFSKHWRGQKPSWINWRSYDKTTTVSTSIDPDWRIESQAFDSVFQEADELEPVHQNEY